MIGRGIDLVRRLQHVGVGLIVIDQNNQRAKVANSSFTSLSILYKFYALLCCSAFIMFFVWVESRVGGLWDMLSGLSPVWV